VSLDPKADARDARFFRWWFKEEKLTADVQHDKEVWDEAWKQALEWDRMESGRG
jgi:hypothetical protein